MQRPALLGLLREILANDIVTAKVQAPAEVRELVESDRVTAIIAVPRIPRTRMALGFVLAFLGSFAVTFSIVFTLRGT